MDFGSVVGADLPAGRPGVEFVIIMVIVVVCVLASLLTLGLVRRRRGGVIGSGENR